MLIEESIKNRIKNAVNKNKIDISLEIPEDPKNGDLTTNIAMVLFGQLTNEEKDSAQLEKPNPRLFAQYIIDKAQIDNTDGIEKVEIAGPGFINIYLEDKVFVNELKQIAAFGDMYGSENLFEGKKIVVEYTDPNPFKVFHIGHLFPNVIGECIANMHEFQGAEVRRANYQGDVGMHVAKAIWGLITKMDKDSINIEDIEGWPLFERIEYLGKAYAKGATAYKDDPTIKEDIEMLNIQIYTIAQERLLEEGWELSLNYKGKLKYKPFPEEKVKSIYLKGREWSLEHFEEIYNRLGTKFDNYYFESEAAEKGVNIVMENLDKGVFKKDQGAIIFEGDKYDLHNRVFINSHGLPTYEAKDLSLPMLKLRDGEYDRSYIVTANEIDDYFKVVLKALSFIDKDLASKNFHLSHGMLDLKSGKMSSRTGNIITGEWLINETVKKTKELMSEDDRISKNEVEEIAETVGISAAKYMILKPALGNGIKFDFDNSISLDGNSAPYLLYTYARAVSVLDRTSDELIEGLKSLEKNIQSDLELTRHEKALIKLLMQYPYNIRRAMDSLSPHYICFSLFAIAQQYNAFYNSEKIIDSGNEKFRLLLTQTTSTVLNKGLSILGIKTLSRM